jgi:hypothetical protein
MILSLKRQGISPKTVIDVGANVGQFAVACKKMFPGASSAFVRTGARMRSETEAERCEAWQRVRLPDGTGRTKRGGGIPRQFPQPL